MARWWRAAGTPALVRRASRFTKPEAKQVQAGATRCERAILGLTD
jgi:hypothetical protein